MHADGSNSALELNCTNLLGAETVDAMRRADRYLQEHDAVALLQQVGTVIPELALTSPTADKRHFPASYGGGKPCGNDLLSARGCFYVTLDGKIMLDCTSGHYQMTWGYNQPELMAVAKEGLDIGVVWDNHANNPGIPVKVLTEKLGNIIESMGMDRAMFGVCTGSVACTTAMKVMLIRYERDEERKKLGKPVMVVLAGNYHGTDIAAQAMRGMWPGFVTGMEVVEVEPNIPEELTAAFEKYGRRIAGFWVEPVMMNREAILVETEYLKLARELCTKYDTLLTFDEIQTGFWYPEIFFALRIGVSPDLIVVGKGMTAGFHPLAGILYRKDLDILEQYDSISTNGNASLAALIALANLELIAEERTRIEALGDQLINGFRCFIRDFPEIIEAINGEGLLAGIKFRTSEDAIGFQRVVLDRGLWVRVHAYHPGHRTVLCKLALSADERIVDFIVSSMRSILETTAWR
jgi:adenosylmethionine-8-amino-7-oxononanoate aminotransferase